MSDQEATGGRCPLHPLNGVPCSLCGEESTRYGLFRRHAEDLSPRSHVYAAADVERVLAELAAAGAVEGETRNEEKELARVHPSAHAPTVVEGSPAPQWQPIETAPKDGTTILLALREFNIPSVDFGWHNGDHWRNYEDAHGMLFPTHWMPLPDPPLGYGGRDHQEPKV